MSAATVSLSNAVRRDSFPEPLVNELPILEAPLLQWTNGLDTEMLLRDESNVKK